MNADKSNMYEIAHRAYQERRFADALSVYETIAHGGDTDAQKLVGWMYFKGRGAKRDLNVATNWLLRAAESDDEEAHFLLGVINEENGNFQGAKDRYLIAVERGYEPAMYRLSIVLENKDILPCDFDSLALLKRAANQGHIFSQLRLLWKSLRFRLSIHDSFSALLYIVYTPISWISLAVSDPYDRRLRRK